MGVWQFTGSWLVILAHPDDELFCSSLIAILTSLGQRVKVLVLTRGEGKEKDWTAAKIRGREFKKSCQRLGVTDCAVWDFPDGGLENLQPGLLAKSIKREIRVRKPDFLLTFAGDGWTHHRDHISTSHSVVEAAKDIPVFGVTLPEPFSHRVLGHLQARRRNFNSYDDNVRHPSLEGLLSVKMDMKAKRAVVAAHISQNLLQYLSVFEAMDEYYQKLVG